MNTKQSPRMEVNHVRMAAVVIATLLLGGCAGLGLFGGDHGPDADIVQSSQYCGTRTPDASLHYFATPDAFRRWIERNDIRELRPGAASLRGVLVVEMGERPSAGYSLEVDDAQTVIQDHTLNLAMRWNAPDIDDQVAQVMISPCVVIPPPEGDYDKVVLRDQRGKVRGQATLR